MKRLRGVPVTRLSVIGIPGLQAGEDVKKPLSIMENTLSCNIKTLFVSL